MSKLGRPVKSPPDEWVTKRKADGMDDASIRHRWENEMTMQDRSQARLLPVLRAKTLIRAKERVAAGAVDQRTLTIVQKGGYTMHATAEAAAAAKAATSSAHNDRVSTEWQKFRDEFSTGCVEGGCPLGPANLQHLTCILNHDFKDRQDKPKGFNSEDLSQRNRHKYLDQLECTCMWHHFVRDRKDLGYGAIATMHDPAARKLATIKIGIGCQHPAHSSMPYAALVPQSASADPLLHAFLDVSHKRLGEVRGRELGYEQKMADLASERAVVHCRFCHRLWTICEYSKLHSRPASDDQFSKLLQISPAFVAHFEETTAGFDWVAEKARLSDRHRNCKPKRRRTHSEEQPLPVAEVDSEDERGLDGEEGYTEQEEKRLCLCY